LIHAGGKCIEKKIDSIFNIFDVELSWQVDFLKNLFNIVLSQSKAIIGGNKT